MVLTVHPRRSAQVLPPCTLLPVVHVPDNVSMSSFLFPAYPDVSSALSLSDQLTEIMMCGTLPSSAITFNRSTVSEFPTTSSSKIGRYFSTLQVILVLSFAADDLPWHLVPLCIEELGRRRRFAF